VGSGEGWAEHAEVRQKSNEFDEVMESWCATSIGFSAFLALVVFSISPWSIVFLPYFHFHFLRPHMA